MQDYSISRIDLYYRLQHASVILNNNMKSRNMNSFTKETIFLEHLGFPRSPDVTFLSHFYQKDGVSNINVAAIFIQDFVRNCSQ